LAVAGSSAAAAMMAVAKKNTNQLETAAATVTETAYVTT
jgi:hypothetical protein